MRGCAAAILIAIALGLPSGAAAAEIQKQPLNVLFISVDDLRPEIGSYGAPAITPNIDRLAESGIRFDRAYAQAAACSASRASMLTGVYPHTTGVYNMEHLADINPGLETLPQIFKKAGYEAVEIGKFSHMKADTAGHWSRESSMPEWKPPEYLAPKNREHSGRKARPRGPPTESADVSDEDYVDGRIALAAIKELRRMKDRPFLLAVGFIRPHLPFNCPSRYWELYDPAKIAVPDTTNIERAPKHQWHRNYELTFYEGGKRNRNPGPLHARTLIHGYRACVSYIDTQIGKLLDELDRLDLSERTAVVLWGDHGWHLGEHRIWGKATALETALRIPLIVRVPGITERGSRSEIVETVDILPTLCELAGLPVPKQTQGTSFAPLLSGRDPGWKQNAFGWAHRKLFSAQTVRTDRYRLVRWVTNAGGRVDAVELYDHANDPREYANLADDPEHAKTLLKMNALLDSWLPE